jgi:hypothetical protein
VGSKCNAQPCVTYHATVDNILVHLLTPIDNPQQRIGQTDAVEHIEQLALGRLLNVSSTSFTVRIKPLKMLG